MAEAGQLPPGTFTDPRPYLRGAGTVSPDGRCSRLSAANAYRLPERPLSMRHWCRSGAGEITAIHRDGDTGDEAGPIAEQRRDGEADLLRFPDPLHRLRCDQAVHELLR